MSTFITALALTGLVLCSILLYFVKDLKPEDIK